MDGDRQAATRKRRGPDRSQYLSVRDLDGTLREQVETYAARRGRTLSEAVRELVAKGLEASESDRVQLHELIPSLHNLIDELHQRVPAELDKRLPASQAFNRTMLVTVLEAVMLLRQMAAASLKPDVLGKARKNTHDTYQQLIKDGTA